MAELKTKPTTISVDELIATAEPQQKREDSLQLIEIMKKLTNSEPIIWGKDIIGFGDYHYKYASGREGDWFRWDSPLERKHFQFIQ